jgi:PhnB protein
MARKRTAVKRGAAKGVRRAARRPAGARVQPIPAGYHSVTPYLTLNEAAKALEFYTRAFGARVTERMPGPGGKLAHAELRIGDSVVMLSDEMPASKCKAPASLGGATASLFLYVPNVDRAWQRAVGAGCQVVTPLADMFWGDRYGTLQDPFGNVWGLASHKEDVSRAELKRRAQAAMSQMAGPPP